MLMIKTYLAPSEIHGIGLFAGEDVAKEHVIWKFNPLLDHILTKRKLLNFCKDIPKIGLDHIFCSTYKRNGKYFYITDNARFINHSEENYNVIMIDDYTEIARTEIAKDEELLENYSLCYDLDDFFFDEMKQLDVYDYMKKIRKRKARNVKNKNLSG